MTSRLPKPAAKANTSKHVVVIPTAVCYECLDENPKRDGLCDKCIDKLEGEFDREVIANEPGPGRIHYGMWLPDSTNYPDAA